jgi:hypothetical protein
MIRVGESVPLPQAPTDPAATDWQTNATVAFTAEIDHTSISEPQNDLDWNLAWISL